MTDVRPIGRTLPVPPTRPSERERETGGQPRRRPRRDGPERRDDNDDGPHVDEYA